MPINRCPCYSDGELRSGRCVQSTASAGRDSTGVACQLGGTEAWDMPKVAGALELPAVVLAAASGEWDAWFLRLLPASRL